MKRRTLRDVKEGVVSVFSSVAGLPLGYLAFAAAALLLAAWPVAEFFLLPWVATAVFKTVWWTVGGLIDLCANVVLFLWLPLGIGAFVYWWKRDRVKRACILFSSACILLFLLRLYVVRFGAFGHVFSYFYVVSVIYVLLLLGTPQAMWSVMGGVVVVVKGVIIAITPDLPTALDDVAMTLAVVLYIFVVVHSTVAVFRRFINGCWPACPDAS